MLFVAITLAVVKLLDGMVSVDGDTQIASVSFFTDDEEAVVSVTGSVADAMVIGIGSSAC
jgi:hypothetical protein